MPYQLPTDPFIPNDDPLGVVDAESPSQYQVLDALLHAAATRLSPQTLPEVIPTLIEDIAYTLHGNGSINTAGLRDFLVKHQQLASIPAISSLLSAARRLPEHFPSHILYPLARPRGTLTFDGAQVNSLLAHQFLGTLSQPEDTDWGLPCFTGWYAGGPAHPRAVDGYLTTMLSHFGQDGYSNNESFTFTLSSGDGMPDPLQCHSIPMVDLRIVNEESEPSKDPGETFILVAAHCQPGPGVTGTQEERLQSASQALSISALVSPRIPDNAAVLTSSFPVHAAWKGHNRTARLDDMYAAEARPRRHYILADALQLDDVVEEEGLLKDFQPGKIEREVRKLYAAFYGAVKMQEKYRKTGPCIVEAGAWGCGAFGGNLLVKTVCIMIAAGLTRVHVRLTLLELRQEEIEFVRLLLTRRHATADLWKYSTATQTLREFVQSLQS